MKGPCAPCSIFRFDRKEVVFEDKGVLCEKKNRTVCQICSSHFFRPLSYDIGLPDVFCRRMGTFYVGGRVSIQLQAVSGDSALSNVLRTNRYLACALESGGKCDWLYPIWRIASSVTREKDGTLQSGFIEF